MEDGAGTVDSTGKQRQQTAAVDSDSDLRQWAAPENSGRSQRQITGAVSDGSDSGRGKSGGDP